MNDYERVANVIRFLDRHHTEQPDLNQLASAAGLSPFHFHRLFSAWAGVTPKDFLQCLTLEHVKHLLRNGYNVFDAALNAGLSGPGRLHDLCVTLEAASPEHATGRKPLGQWGGASAAARVRLSFRATASFAERAHSASIIGTRFASAPSSDGSSCHQARSAGKKPVESGPPRLNNQPKIDIVAAPKYRKRSLLAYGQDLSRLRRFSPRVHRRRIAAGRSRSRPNQTVSELVRRSD